MKKIFQITFEACNYAEVESECSTIYFPFYFANSSGTLTHQTSKVGHVIGAGEKNSSS